MESSPSSKLSFFKESGAIIQCPIEGQKCGIAIDLPRELWDSISLKVDNETLPLKSKEAALCAHSEWPARGPGNYVLSLECGDISERLNIIVVPQHFTEDDYRCLLSEMTEMLPISIAAHLQECGGLLSTNLEMDHEPSIVQEYAKLRRAIVGTKDRLGILQILPIIERDCHQTLIPRHDLRKTNKARKPDISRLPECISMPNNFFASGALKQVFDVTVERSFETYENRLVKAYVQALQSQMARLQARLASESAPPALADEIESLLNELRLASTRATFLREVRQPFRSAGRVTMVLLKRPAYRAVLEGYLALFKQSSVRLEEPALKTPLLKFPFLYQLWANLKVVNVLLQICAELGYRCSSHPWIKRDNTGLYIQVMNDAEAALELSSPVTGTIVSVVPWRTDSGNETARSTSFEQPPALAVAIYAPEKQPVVILFDPKYKVASDATKLVKAKTGKAKTGTAKPELAETETAQAEFAGKLAIIEPMKQDIDELLHCMDSIRSPEGVQEIQYAAILYPGLRKTLSPHLEALPARPTEGAALELILRDVLRKYLSA